MTPSSKWYLAKLKSGSVKNGDFAKASNPYNYFFTFHPIFSYCVMILTLTAIFVAIL